MQEVSASADVSFWDLIIFCKLMQELGGAAETGGTDTSTDDAGAESSDAGGGE